MMRRLVGAVGEHGGDVLRGEVEGILEVVRLATCNLVEGSSASGDDGLGDDLEGDQEVRGGAVVLARGGGGGEAWAAEGGVRADVSGGELVLVDGQAGLLGEGDDVVQEGGHVGQDLDAAGGGAAGIRGAVGQHGAGHVRVGQLGEAVGLLGGRMGVLPDKGLGVEHAGVVGAKESREGEEVVGVLATVEEARDSEGVEGVGEELSGDGGAGEIGRDNGWAGAGYDVGGVKGSTLGNRGHDDRVGGEAEGDFQGVGVVDQELLGVQAVLLVRARGKVLVALCLGLGTGIGGELGNNLDGLLGLVDADGNKGLGQGDGELGVDVGVTIGAVVAGTLVRDLGGKKAELAVGLGNGSGLLDKRGKRGNERGHGLFLLALFDPKKSNTKHKWSTTAHACT